MNNDITKRHKGVHKWVAAVYTLVAIVVDEWVGGGAAVTQRLVLLVVMERLSTNFKSSQFHIFLWE